jgi:hypothetical protein
MSCAQVENFQMETTRQSTIRPEPRPFIVARSSATDVTCRVAAALEAELANGSMPA